ncbi:MAG: glycerol kinase GlpK [Armatimonadota bacterium]|nr:glycerol kinase GlpK [Armatimonadota bacterium]MDR5676451.1 glycerol kinase GlpK [Armatimonadota bacterium]MDR7386022.1 glycerol kinase GlpK [Armatimonadota bacterium]MDR7389527.1 glycerol kinase GlpK [Armatimonadota bacterium]MDR7393841.1 glycerol kinase GlpK [Armatimonadota bacterium]
MRYVGAVDQGTSSTRFLVFDERGRVVASAQEEHRQITPQPGWVEHDPVEIWERTRQVVRRACSQAGITPRDLAAVGVTNQRETTVVWERATGRPVANAVVWQDTRTDTLCRELSRTGGVDRFRERTGLPVATYFSGPKLRWILDHTPGAQQAAERGELLFGTVDTWLLWWLTGGPAGGVHVTDVTNASRTLLMNLHTLDWDDGILRELGIPRAMLPEIRSSCEVYGEAVVEELSGVLVAADLGDQQAALFGQTCFSPGEAKNTYGTGCFLLLNTGPQPVASRHGLLTTVAYQLCGSPPAYALEGSVAIAGAAVQWLRDNLGLIRTSPEVEELARSVEDNGGVYFVPAFSGLFAPHWRSDARGVIVGLTRHTHRGHIARATLEATAYQTREVLEAMVRDSGVRPPALRVDGGMVRNQLLMQFQADVLGIPVVRAAVQETTALGAAYAAGLAVGVWKDLDELRSLWAADRSWQPAMPAEAREALYRRWLRAVERTFGWLEG